jgi:hypothetical protein
VTGLPGGGASGWRTPIGGCHLDRNIPPVGGRLEIGPLSKLRGSVDFARPSRMLA